MGAFTSKEQKPILPMTVQNLKPAAASAPAQAPVVETYQGPKMKLEGGGSRKKSKARFSAKRKKTNRKGSRKADRKSRKNRRCGY